MAPDRPLGRTPQDVAPKLLYRLELNAALVVVGQGITSVNRAFPAKAVRRRHTPACVGARFSAKSGPIEAYTGWWPPPVRGEPEHRAEPRPTRLDRVRPGAPHNEADVRTATVIATMDRVSGAIGEPRDTPNMRQQPGSSTQVNDPCVLSASAHGATHSHSPIAASAPGAN